MTAVMKNKFDQFDPLKNKKPRKVRVQIRAASQLKEAMDDLASSSDCSHNEIWVHAAAELLRRRKPATK